MTAPPAITGLTFVRPLGSGGYCDVLLYQQDEPRMKVAVKVLTAPGSNPERRRQFSAEGNAMAALADHPFIVPVFRAGVTADDRPFLVMQFYPEPNLAQRSRHERISVAEVLRIGIQISSAVETAHRSGILHRDVKPANVLGGPYGNPGLTDFGLTAVIAESDAPADGVSVPWAAPEVLLESAPPDVRADVYSLAATVWHLLIGRSPFEQPGGDNSSTALRDRILTGSPTPFARPDVPDMLDRLLRQAMAGNPQLRPTSALAFAQGLQRVEQEQRLALTQIVVPAGARLAEATSASSTRVRASIPRPLEPPPLRPAPAPTAPTQAVPVPARPTDQRLPAAGPPMSAPPLQPVSRGPAAVRPATPPPVTEPEPPAPVYVPVYAQWPPPVEDWSAPVLSTPGPPARSWDPRRLWVDQRTAVVAVAMVLLVVLILAVALLA